MTETAMKNKIITIPNVLSILRICMIPPFVWLYIKKADYATATIILILSGITDVLDGFIARRFNMSSDFGKAIDPVADKLTQFTMLICLMTKFSFMWIPVLLLFVKEIFLGITSLLAIKKTGEVHGAKWHGKVATCLIYGMIFTHVIWYDIPYAVSMVFLVSSVTMMLISCFNYAKRNYMMLKNAR